jgi:photosystem II stability/assembly factor-like uncharacterized protein
MVVTALRKSLTALIGGLVLFTSATADANGMFPKAGQLVVAPSNPDHIVVRTTFGLVTSRNGGGDWSWICESAMGYANIEPGITITSDGVVVAGVYDGVTAAAGDSCTWSSVAGTNQESVADVSRAPSDPSVVMATARDLTTGVSRYLESSGAVTSFAQVGVDLPAGLVPITLDGAPSDPTRIYLSALRDIGGGQFVGALVRSSDHAGSWSVIDIPGSLDDSRPYLAAVHPTQPDALYVRLATTPGILLYSSDAGQSWTNIFTGAGALDSFALSPDGATVLVGGPVDGVWRANTLTHSFESVSTLPATCLTWTARGVYGCFTFFANDYVIALSSDQAETFTPLLDLQCLQGPLDCSTDTPVGAQCPMQWSNLALQFDVMRCGGGGNGAGGNGGAGVGGSAASTGGAGAGAAPPTTGPGSDATPASGCGCNVPGRAGTVWPWLLGVFALLRRRVQGTQPNPSTS